MGVDRVINGNSLQLATTRRAELLRMLTDQNGSVREISPTARAVVGVAWKFLEFRSSWARVLDPEEADVDSVTGHGALYAELARLKRARTLKFIRRATRRAHDALHAFCVAAEPLNALRESSDDSLRGFHDELEFCLGVNGAYAERRAYETALSFCRGVVADALKDSIEPLAERAIEATRGVLRRRLAERRVSAVAARDSFGGRRPRLHLSSDARVQRYPLERSLRCAVRRDVVVQADGWITRRVRSPWRVDGPAAPRRDGAEDGDGRGGETAFESLVRRTIMDLGGEETDPKRAMTRALIAMSLSKFTLGSGLKKAYARPGGAASVDGVRATSQG